MKNLPVGLWFLIAAGAVALVVVFVQDQRASSRAAGWEALSVAQEAGNSAASLEKALESAKGTPAEPWIALQLGRKLYDSGTRDSLERARQLAQQAMADFPDHAVRPDLDRLVTAVESVLIVLPA